MSSSQDQTFIMTFKDKKSYEKYKNEVIGCGGAIKNDLGETLLGFTAVMPLSLVQLIQSNSLAGNGIDSFERDSTVKIQ